MSLALWISIVLANWLVPLVLSWAYILFAWIPGWIEFYRYAGGLTWAFDLQDEKVDNWYTRAWAGWGGFGAMTVVILRDRPSQSPGGRYTQILAHEVRHSKQVLCLGMIQPVLYMLFSLTLLLTSKLLKFTPDTHPYYDNPFERDARWAAGQQVNIPRSKWYRGPDDYWPWM
jgi:hypothetical protein